MKIFAINGSPRKDWNTATILNKVLEGAASQGAKTEIIHLYDINYKGCVSCFGCKLKNGKSYGKCAYKDGLTPLLDKLENADAVILGSPVYFGNMTGEMKSFIERFAYPYLVYDENYSSLYPKKINIGLIYTMNVDENRMKMMGYEHSFNLTEMFMKRTFGEAETLLVKDTYQFADYSNYVCSAFDPAQKAEINKKQFPIDCQKAFDMGVKFATKN